MPFWFWNDPLDEQELLRQIDDFQAHGVHGFVIHPRMGLPPSLGWMSVELLRFMAIAINAAAKCSSSAMMHYGRRRNSNEFCGAYGHETTFDEFQWLANWCLVRGVNLLIPHAFYYSVRGPRRDERPPQVGGVGCKWWGDFKPFADHCRLISWLNTDSKHHCRIAILTAPDQCPWKAAKVCFEHQRDFNYLDVTLLDSPEVLIDASGLHIQGMCYEVLICEDIAILNPTSSQRLRPMIDRGSVINFASAKAELIPLLDDRIRPSIATSAACPDLRIRLVEKDAAFWVLLFNEGSETIATELSINWPRNVQTIERIDTVTRWAGRLTMPIPLRLDSHATALFRAAISPG
jgi:hypothetical protein